MNQQRYKWPLQVRSYEVGKDGYAGVAHIANYFQEAAGLHAQQLHFDIADLHKRGLTWVLYRLHITVEHYPKRWDSITVSTRPSSGDGLRAFRDYALHTETGEIIAKGISQWMVLDVQKKRPVRLPNEIMELGLDDSGHLLEPNKNPLPTIDHSENETLVTVGQTDLDMNGHVNNTRYIAWMLDFLPEEWQNGHQCTSFELQYYKEARMRDELVVRSSADTGTIIHEITDKDSREVIARGESRWEAVSV
ncbi:MAG: acyl-[acyl-carrier-protein] thioesterase [Balneolaceae bacterium]